MPEQEQGTTDRNAGDVRSADASPEELGLPAGWTRARVNELADKVYELLLRDLNLERERGSW